MKKRVILIDENILTEDMNELKKALDKAVITIKKVTDGVYVNEFEDAIKDIEEVSGILSCLAEKKFVDATVSTLFIEK